MKNSNIFKKMISSFAVALCVTLLTPGIAQAKSQVALDKKNVTVCTGKTYTLKMSGISKKVKWSTSDKNVVAISKKGGKKSEKVTIKGVNKGTATVAAKVKVGKKTKTFKCQVKVAGHKYSEVSYKWNKDYTKCTASKKCTRCGKTLKQTVKTTNKTTKATCTETGKKKYTAQFTKYNFGTKTKSVTIKAKGHKVNSDKKISYKWNNGYSKCTATYYCKNGGEKQTESVKTSKKTTPATKTSEGKIVYTATFKTKGLQAQTKKVSIPKLAYLTLNGKEVNQISVGYGKPVTVTLCNDTIESTEFTWYGTKTSQYIYCPDGDLNNQIVKEKTETKDWPATKGTGGKINGNQLTISTKDKPAEEENLTLTITTSRGQTIQCAVNVEFTPGEYNFGEVNMCYHGYHDTNTTPEFREYYSYTYVAYGKNKGLYTWYEKGIDSNGNGMYENTEVTTTKLTKTAPDGTVTELPVDSVITTDYIMDCNTKKDYDDAYRFYHKREARNGSICNLEQKTQDIYSECYERADYKSKAEIEWDEMSSEEKELYDDDMWLYIQRKYGDLYWKYYQVEVFPNYIESIDGTKVYLTSNAQVYQIVKTWADKYNNGEMPSWYYYTAFSDWAEWSGRDVNAGRFADWCKLPKNFRD